MKPLTIRESGKVVSNKEMSGVCYVDAIKLEYYGQLLSELGFERYFTLDDDCPNTLGYAHKSNNILKARWIECDGGSCTLKISVGEESYRHLIGGEYVIHEFVSQVLDSIRLVWNRYLDTP